ncbi:replication initiation factor domain-containing protein [Lactobacillus crispatus]|uniref:replication initiation factor domain-containing protein n=1 Tax=Lactobacillus crispatus TaxID=47770 RepID=UPI0018AAFC52|nr:replication initiation factor domain-containing protein [Lactobacillus crispatus]
MEVQIDWLEFTVLDANLALVFDTIGLNWDDFKSLEKGRFGYHNQLKWSGGHLYVMFTAQNDAKIDIESRISTQSGVHVMITGQGCRQYAAKHDLIKLIRRLTFFKRVNFSRIDLAIDDYESKIISYDRIHDAAIAGHFTSRWSKWDEVTSRRTSSNEYLGRTMYFGSQASDLFCRVYDKTLERKINSNEKSVPEKWTRLEIVYRKDRAKKLVDHLIKARKTLGHVLRGTLRQYLRFVLPPTDSKDQKKTRWKTAPWWDELLKNVDKLVLTIKKEPKTIEEMKDWVDRQISPTIATITRAEEGDMSWLAKLIVKGSHRLTQKHIDAIAQYMEKGIAA